jgi:hypothetical protein
VNCASSSALISPRSWSARTPIRIVSRASSMAQPEWHTGTLSPPQA